MKSHARRRLVQGLGAVALAAGAAGAQAGWPIHFDLIDRDADLVQVWEHESFDSGNWKAKDTRIGTAAGVGASVTQSGGSFVTGTMVLGYDERVQGDYFLYGGSLRVAELQIAALYGGVVQQKGGVLTAGNVNVGTQTCCRGGNKGDLRLEGGLRSIDTMRVGEHSIATLSGGVSIFGTAVSGGYGDMYITGGTHTFSNRLWVQTQVLRTGDRIGGNVEMSGGTVIGRVDNEGSFAWRGGTVDGEFTTTQYGQLLVDGTATSRGSLVNQGAMTILKTSQLNVGSGGFLNDTGGTLSFQDALIQAGGSIVNRGHIAGLGRIAGSGKFENEGSFLAFDGPQLAIDLPAFSNRGSFTLRNMTLRGSGAFANESAGRFVTEGDASIAMRFDNHGRLEVGAGRVGLEGAFKNSGELVLTDAAASISAGAFENRGRISGHGSLKAPFENRGVVRAEGGELVLLLTPDNRAGVLSAAAGGTLTLAAGAPHLEGTLRLEGGRIQVHGATQNHGVIEGAGTLAVGTLVNLGRIQFGAGASRFEGVLDHRAGARLGLAEGAELAIDSAVTLRRGSFVELAAGSTLRFGGAVLIEAGVLTSGDGRYLFDSGLELGPEAASVALAGSARLGAGHVLRMDLAAGGSDHLSVMGTLAFGGTLRLATLDGFDAVAGARYDLFDWGRAVGSFGHIDLSQAVLPDGMRWDTRELYSDGVLRIAAVPEPSTWILSAAGLALVAATGRRRRRHPVL